MHPSCGLFHDAYQEISTDHVQTVFNGQIKEPESQDLVPLSKRDGRSLKMNVNKMTVSGDICREDGNFGEGQRRVGLGSTN